MAWIIDAYEGGDEKKFVAKVGVSRETWRLWKGSARPRLDNLAVILQKYPKVNPEWLVLGRGSRERQGDGADSPALEIVGELGDLYLRLRERFGQAPPTSVDEETERAARVTAAARKAEVPGAARSPGARGARRKSGGLE